MSIELAPSEINTRKLEVLRDMGVNRISLGVQTFDDRLMAELGRDHSPDKARRLLRIFVRLVLIQSIWI